MALLVVFLVLAAGGAAVVSAAEDSIDPNDTNNFAEVSLIANAPVDAPIATNINIGAIISILSPHQTQNQNQAQLQAQTSINTNNNSLTNNNINVAVSTSTATNTNHISNNNTFNPVLIISNKNSIGN